MQSSLDPEVCMAKLLCKLAGHVPDSMISGGYDENGNYYPVFAQTHLFDHKFRDVPEIFAWRKYVIHARKLIEELTRNGQTIYQARPHFYHGDHEEASNFWITFWSDFKPEDFQPAFPAQLIGKLDDGWRFELAVQARSEREAVSKIFDAFVGEPKHIRVLSLEHKPWDWAPFTATFKRKDGMCWSELSPKE